MTDVISEARERLDPDASEGANNGPGVTAELGRDELYWYVEALFFAYRDFINDPDRILSEISFGRAHHRVLHFIYRYPGMRVADLLDILQITKQSLARVLRELKKDGYVMQQPGMADKRERLLYVTQKGAALAGRLAAPQLERIKDALAAVGAEGHSAVARFLKAVMSGATQLPDGSKDALSGQQDKTTMGKNE